MTPVDHPVRLDLLICAIRTRICSLLAVFAIIKKSARQRSTRVLVHWLDCC